MSGARLPVSVIGGFLGAGKTTLLNRLLREKAGRRFAVLVNDFGEIDIDSRLIVQHDGRTITLANGCLCCSIGDSLVTALIDIAQRRGEFDHMLIETSGIADPARVADLIRIEPDFTLDGVIVLADASAVRIQLADRYVGDSARRQLEGADLIVLNKLDLAEHLDDTLARLRETSPGCPILRACHADVSLDLLFGLAPRGAPVQPSHDLSLRRWHFTARAPLDRGILGEGLAALPDSVIRVKGIVDLADSPATQTIVQRVGRRLSLEDGAPWGLAFRHSDIVVLGTPDMPSAEELDRAFADCASSAAKRSDAGRPG
ncbi:MAG: GTP-binding protein [Reyranellaceae bacterium]